MTNEEFKKISSTETAKEAWTILQITYERTKAVKDSKLRRLNASFEEIKMEEDESFDEFYVKLKDIVNSTFNLGEQIPEPKIVRKVLRSLPERFHAKIIAIEESRHKCTFSPYILTFFHFSSHIFILPLLVLKLINACYFHPFRQSIDGNS